MGDFNRRNVASGAFGRGKMKTLVRVLLVGAVLCGPIAPAFAPPASTTFRVDVTTKAKAKGAKGRYSETIDIVFYGDGTFTTEDINAGTWTGAGKKLTLHVPDSDIGYLVGTVAADELGVDLQFVSVTSMKGTAKLKTPKGGGPRSIKGTLKIKGLLNAPGLGLFNIKFTLSLKFAGPEVF